MSTTALIIILILSSLTIYGIIWNVIRIRKSKKYIEKIFSGHASHVNSVRFSPDGKLIVSGSKDKTVKLWEVLTGNLIWSYNWHRGEINAVRFSPNGELIASASFDSSIRIINTKTGHSNELLNPNFGEVKAIDFSPTSNELVCCGESTELVIFNLKKQEITKRYIGHTETINTVKFSPDGKFIISGGADMSVIIRDKASGEIVKRFEDFEDPISILAVSPDGKLLACECYDKMFIFDFNTKELLWTKNFESKGGEMRIYWIKALSFSNDSKTIIAGDSLGVITFFDAYNGTEMRKIVESAGFTISSISVSPDDKYIVTASTQHKKIKMWHIYVKNE